MRAVTHNAQNNKYLFSLIKKKRLGLRNSPPQALTCCTAVTAAVEKFFEAWDGCAAELCTTRSAMMSKRERERWEREEEEEEHDLAFGERGPAGRGDTSNYLASSVNWSHSDLANLSSASFVSDSALDISQTSGEGAYVPII